MCVCVCARALCERVLCCPESAIMTGSVRHGAHPGVPSDATAPAALSTGGPDLDILQHQDRDTVPCNEPTEIKTPITRSAVTYLLLNATEVVVFSGRTWHETYLCNHSVEQNGPAKKGRSNVFHSKSGERTKVHLCVVDDILVSSASRS